MPPYHRLLCALIANDRVSAENILLSNPEDWYLRFLGSVQENGLSALICTKIFELGFREHAASVVLVKPEKTDKEQDGVWIENTLSTNLQRMSAVDMGRADEFERKLVKLMDRLSPLNDHIAWPKGISLARSLYDEPCHRISGDFDVITRPEFAQRFFDLCSDMNFAIIKGDAGFCNQLGVGPVKRLDDFFLVPNEGFVPSAVYGFEKDGWPLIDPKFNVLDRGLAFREVDRFFQDRLALSVGGHPLFAPSHLDHLMICCVHAEKDRFRGWKSLIDVHLLASAVDAAGSWNEFSRRVNLEGARLSAWSALTLVRDRFNSPVPQSLLDELHPGGQSSTLISFTVEPLFYWNCSSAIMLLLNALYTGDRQRKLRALKASFFPPRTFLERYYSARDKSAALNIALALFCHWFVLLLPGFLVRKLFGTLMWPPSDQYGAVQTTRAPV